jgi:hypothetical protein
MSKNMREPGRLQITIRRMRVECWINKATRAQAYAHTVMHPLMCTHAHRMCNTLLFHSNSGVVNAFQCYVNCVCC